MGEITIRKALDDYRTVYMSYRNFADRTREEYQNDLEDFVKFLKQKGINNVGELGLPIIERYVSHLEAAGYSSLTRKRKVVAIRSFLAFLYQDGYITSNIGKRVAIPFTEYPSPNFLTQKECDRLRFACSDSSRNSAIIELVLQTGIKLSELVRLTLDDVELDESNTQGFIRIKGSGRNNERVVPLTSKACNAIRRYSDARGDTGNGALFINRLGEPLGESGVQKCSQST